MMNYKIVYSSDPVSSPDMSSDGIQTSLVADTEYPDRASVHLQWKVTSKQSTVLDSKPCIY